MKQILQNLKSGELELAELPVPGVRAGHLLIKTSRSLISLGTERMLLEFGKAGWIEKARQQPDKVRQVLQKVKNDGLIPTVDAVFRKLDQPVPLGYSNAGVVLEVGGGVRGFKPGDRVISNGYHAEVVCVPENLCARIPDQVTDEAACCTVVAAIALQGVRLVSPTLGERVAVLGLGLIGLMTCQILRANGCQVLGFDFDPAKVALARIFGAEAHCLADGVDPVASGLEWSGGCGVDAVIITAATRSNDPIQQAPQMCRKRGRVVLVGVIGLELSRDDFFKKEISFQVSCSYGPGRYDPAYEQKGLDYPIGFVRWTESRNFTAVLDLMADGRFTTERLVSHRFPIGKAHEAYAIVGGKADAMGIVLEYDGSVDLTKRHIVLQEVVSASARQCQRAVRRVASEPSDRAHEAMPAMACEPVVGFIGAGNFSASMLIPAFQEAGATLRTIASAGGVTGTHLGRKSGFHISTTDYHDLLVDPKINVVSIATPHASHARLVCECLASGKHVFVEKPLCLTSKELEEVVNAYRQANERGPVRVMVGFNRRFSPLTLTMKRLLGAWSGPKASVMTVNAGAIPLDHWTQDAESGGGRILGEACHFIDLLRDLTGHPIANISTTSMADASSNMHPPDSVSISMTFADGSIGTVHYLANGHKGFPKERLEVFFGGRILHLDNFRSLTGFGVPGFKGESLWSQDKGHQATVAAFLQAVRTGGPSPISFAELVEVTEATLKCLT